MAHTKKYILDHYECDGQLSIDDLPFKDKNVDNIFEFGPHNPCCTIEECVGCLFGCYLA